MKTLRVFVVAAAAVALASIEAAVWTAGDLQQRLSIQGVVLLFAALILAIPAFV